MTSHDGDLIRHLLADPEATALVDRIFDQIDRELAAVEIVDDTMPRKELTFHPHIKLLGYLAIATRYQPGDFLEIGVWKGKSLAMMDRLSPRSTRTVGVDPFELPGQANVVEQLHAAVFPDALLVQAYSQIALTAVIDVSHQFKLLHIDGGHLRGNVWTDFLLYEHLVVPGGFVVFDDYRDVTHSPEVGPAVDELAAKGMFDSYVIHGPVEKFDGHVFLLEKRRY